MNNERPSEEINEADMDQEDSASNRWESSRGNNGGSSKRGGDSSNRGGGGGASSGRSK